MSENRSHANQRPIYYPYNPSQQQIPVATAPQMPMPQFTIPRNIIPNPYRQNNPTPTNSTGLGDEPPSYNDIYPSVPSTFDFAGTPSHQPIPYPPLPYPPSTGASGLPYPPPMAIYQPERSTRIPGSSTTRNTGEVPFPQTAFAISNTLACTSRGQQRFPPYSNTNQEIGFCRNETGRPTLRPTVNFNPEADAKVLARTLTWDRPSKPIIIKILCKRSVQQRLMIDHRYKLQTHETLTESLLQKISPGTFLNFMLFLMNSVDESNVHNLYQAIERKDYNVVAEILCTISNQEIKHLKNCYLITYSKDLETHITEKATSHCKFLLLEICKCNRDETENLNTEEAITIAKNIHDVSEDQKCYLNVFAKSNFKQIKVICEQYEKLFGCSIDTKIKKDFELYDMQCYLVIARFARNKLEFYAKQLHQSMKGLGTNDIQLMRIIITRCEVDLQDIKDAFKKITGDSLKSWVEDDTSGHFRTGLLELLGESK